MDVQEKLAMMQAENDNLQAKVAFLEGLLKKAQEDRRIPTRESQEIRNDVSY